jgi:NADH-quinone oxidoreductase subunit E
MSATFSQDLDQKIRSYLVRYETPRSAILPILHAIQDEKDWISDADILALENEYQLSSVHVREVLTFYSMYRTSPPKPYRLEICKSISCFLMGAKDSIHTAKQAIEDAKKNGIDLPFEVHEVECLGQCGYAPAGFVNKDRQNNITPQRALELIKEYTDKHNINESNQSKKNV